MLKYLFVLIIVSTFIGCAIEQTVYFQNIEVKGPVNNPPIIATTYKSLGKIIVSPRLNINQNVNLAGQVNTPKVNSENIFQIDTIDGRFKASSKNIYDYKGNNFYWRTPNVTGGVDFDIPISFKSSVLASFNFSSANNLELYGGSLGFSFYSISPGNHAIRFSLGLTLQQIAYNANTIIIQDVDGFSYSSQNDVILCTDVNKSSNVNVFLSLTYNTSFTEFPLNVLLNASFFTQTVIDYAENHPNQEFIFVSRTINNETNYRTGFFTLSPGLVFDISEWNRIMIGATLMFNTTDLKTMDSNISPMLKIDFLF